MSDVWFIWIVSLLFFGVVVGHTLLHPVFKILKDFIFAFLRLFYSLQSAINYFAYKECGIKKRNEKLLRSKH